MTTLYRPVLIESAEQAEELPIGTVAARHDGDWHDAAVKLFGGAWREASAEDWVVSGVEVVGWTALVPIEAEEETKTVSTSDGKWHVGNGHWTRLVTPWEEA